MLGKAKLNSYKFRWFWHDKTKTINFNVVKYVSKVPRINFEVRLSNGFSLLLEEFLGWGIQTSLTISEAEFGTTSVLIWFWALRVWQNIGCPLKRFPN